MRQRAIILAVVVLLAVGLVAGAFIYSKSQTVMAGMSGRLETELTKALGGSVSVGGVEVASLNRVMLYDVVVRDEAGRLLAAGDRVAVVYDPLALLRGVAAVEAVRELALSAPRISLVRHADGRWNVDDMLEKTRSGDSPFGGRITIERGTVTVAAPDGSWQLDDIAGYFDFAAKPDVALKATATYRGAPLEAAGRLSKDGPAMLAVSAAGLDLDGLAPLLPADAAVKPAGGRLAEAQVIVRRDKGGLVYAGEAKLDGVGFDVAGFPVREARGTVAFSDKQVFLFPVTAKVYGQAVEVRGKIATEGAEPVLGLTVTAAGFDPAALGAEVPVRGAVSFAVTVGGTPARPVVSGEVKLAKGEAAGYAVEGAAARFGLVEKVLTVNGLEAAMFGGKVAGTGTVLVDKGQYYIAASGQGLDMASLPDLGLRVSGRGDVELRLEGTGSLAAAKVAGTVRAVAGQISGVPFASLTGGFYKTGGLVNVDYLTVGFSGGAGLLMAKGTVEDGRLALTMFGQGVPLTAFAGQTGGLGLSGTADAEGRVEGTTDAPRLTARFTAYNGRVLEQPFTLARGEVAITRDAVTLTGVEAANGAARHVVAGSVGLTGRRELNLTVATRQARAEDLVRLILPGERLTGNVDNEVTVTGTLGDLTAVGKVKLTEGSFRGQLIAKAEGSYRRQGGATELRDFVVDSLNAQVRFGGTISADGQLAFDVSARDIELSSLYMNFPYPVAGRANFDGRLTGTPQAPVFSGEIAAKSLRLNGQELSDIGGRLSVNGERIEVPQFGFAQGTGRFAFAGGIRFADGAIYGNLSATSGSVGSLLAILGIPAKDVDGRLDGEVAVGGTVAKPNIWLTGTLTAGKIRNYPLETIEVDIGLHDNLVTVNRFYAKQGGGVLAAKGTAALNGPLNLEVGGRGLDAGLLTAWLDSTVDTQGKLTFTAQVTGTADSPHAAVSLEITGGGVESATFDALYGLLILDKGSIHVNQVMLTKGPYRASAYGTVPLAALNREGRAKASIADQMDLKVRLEQANLSILPLLTKEVAWAAGETRGELTVAGTLVQPLLYGSLAVRDGTVKLKSLADPVQKVGVDIQFEGDKISIKTFDGRLGGGTFRLSGSAAIQGLALADYRMVLALDKLAINHKYFKGPVDGTLTINSSGGRPVLSGRLVFENTTANIPMIPDFKPSGLDLGLDLEVVAGSRVRLLNPYLYDLWVEGKARFAGTVQAPAASGRFTAIRGTVNYLRTQFRVNSGSADFNQFGSFLPAIRLAAETKLEFTKVNLAVTGPLNAMEFRLNSEPGMSQQQILSLLTLRSRYYDKQGQPGSGQSGLGRDELLSLLDAGLQMTFVAEAESVFRNSFGLDEFRLVRSTLSPEAEAKNGSSSTTEGKPPTLADREVYNIEIGKYVTDRLFISYTLGIDHKETSAYFRYDLSRRLSVTGAIDELSRRRIGIETRFNF